MKARSQGEDDTQRWVEQLDYAFDRLADMLPAKLPRVELPRAVWRRRQKSKAP